MHIVISLFENAAASPFAGTGRLPSRPVAELILFAYLVVVLLSL